MKESAGARIRLVIDHPSDAERIDVAERADVVAVRLPLLLVVLPPQVVLEAVRRGVRAVVRRQIGRVAARDRRSVAGRPHGGTFDRGIVRRLEDLRRPRRGSAVVVRRLRSLVAVEVLQAGRWVTWPRIRVVIVADDRRVGHARPGSDSRRRVVTGSDVVAG